MKKGLFWEKDANKISAIIDAFDQLSDNSYIWVTNLKKHETWCTEKTQELFSLPDQIIPDFEQKLTEYLFPEDRPEYLQKIKQRMLGTDPDQELCIRMRTQDGSYSLFSIHTQILSDENDTPEYLIVLIKNENIFRKIDALTDLYSEVRYIDDLKKVIAQENRFAILQIHVKGFSTFNLVYGRDFSSKLLREIAIRFIYMMDADKAVYRLESECFVFILKKAGREELLDFDRKVRHALDIGIMVDGQLHPLKIASGAILLENYCGDVSSLCGQVAYALNHSINKRQHQIVIFNDEVKTANGADLALMKVIHQSVRNNCEGFYLVYQPIVDSNTGEMVGAEALVRWSREPYGTVPPGMFIEWLETDPSMYDLGNFVLRTALSETKPLLASKPDFFINVNLSVRQLERPEFHQEVEKILDETKFPAGNLCMELTERCKDFPLDVLKKEVCYFQSLGIRVAMDDYGTGSASSNIVMNVPMNEIKIDMSFIRGIIDNPKNQAMVRSILYFADKSNMATCLEGVENEELQNYLRDYNATWFQGYYYSKPIPLNELVKLMK